jgi:hypothetical protein
MFEDASAQYHARFKRTPLTAAFLHRDNLEQLHERICAELYPRTQLVLEVDQALIDELHEFTLNLADCGGIAVSGVGEANDRFMYKLLKPVVASAQPEAWHREFLQEARQDQREEFYKRQYRHAAMERPTTSAERQQPTVTSDYMLQHPFGSDGDNYML